MAAHDAIAAFEADLSTLVQAAGDRFAVTHDARRWRFCALDPEGFDLDVQLRDDAVRVCLGGWCHEERLAGEPDDADALDAALDLVAAALWGKVALHETRAGGRPWRWTAIVRGPRGERALPSQGGGIFGWRPGTTTMVRTNRAAPPAGTTIGEIGRLPTRPWIGVRGTSRADDAPRALPVHGELDLHPFSPKEVGPLVLQYIEVCRAQGITQLRIVHGKGIGNLRRTVHALLDRHEAVASYRLGGHGEGGWGATIVVLGDR